MGNLRKLLSDCAIFGEDRNTDNKNGGEYRNERYEEKNQRKGDAY
jgi:hypothetical protein